MIVTIGYCIISLVLGFILCILAVSLININKNNENN